MTDEDLAHEIARKFWPEIRTVLAGYYQYYSSSKSQSYSVIEIPILELGRRVLTAIGFDESTGRKTNET